MTIIKARATWVDNYRSIADNARQHSMVLDLPTDSGGENKGPSALELAIMSLADCAVTIFADVAYASAVPFSKLEVIAEAEKSEDSPTLTGVTLKVRVKGNARDQKMRALWRRTEANCPVVKIFTEKIPITAEFTLE
ncbi:MAG: OsmC family protein [Candidatus Bathyarchaeota archaeon]|nr:OsmC family protein [Candidatus Bathyarchaeota archaeon]